ncbi:MAG: ABC transporter ATP-binding protein [Oscillospiraceae bacterium]|nr:ABC transporter ATP-binding protein [Oscillospiraceae bacterium]
MLSIQNLTKSYGKKVAVQNLSLEVNAGEIFGFIGHNGAGKTTTLRCVAGILPYTEGVITIDGHDVQKDPLNAKQALAFLPDNPDLYEYLTGVQYLNFIADIFRLPADVRTARIKDHAERFELSDALQNPIASYSHGMKQKLAIISALIHEPKLLILDEPFVGLDPSASHLLKTLLRELCGRGGAVFFSTHVLEVAEKLCDRVAIIQNGSLIRQGKTADIVGDSSLEDVFLGLQEKEES